MSEWCCCYYWERGAESDGGARIDGGERWRVGGVLGERVNSD